MVFTLKKDEADFSIYLRKTDSSNQKKSINLCWNLVILIFINQINQI